MHLDMQQRRTLLILGEFCKATCLALVQHGCWSLQMSQRRCGELMPILAIKNQ